MIEFSKRRIREIDTRSLPLLDSLEALRNLTIDEFGELLLSLPSEDVPHLTTILPAMASEEVQRWRTGNSGVALLRQSVSFMNFAATNFCLVTGRPFKNVNVLDFGCGWGRLIRLLAYFNDPEYSFACDAWDVSLEEFRSCGVEKLVSSLLKSDHRPLRLPYDDNQFDLVYAFSVFTHLSEKSARACIDAIYKAIKPTGVVILTIRTLEFWKNYKKISEEERNLLIKEHLSGKYTFYPHPLNPINKKSEEPFYGDTSIPVDIFETVFDQWRIVRAGSTMLDSMQVFLVLKPLK